MNPEENKIQAKKIVVAIDGHSSCGKSTIARDLAKAVNYKYIDSGAMYRAVTLYCIENGLFEGNRLDEETLKEKIQQIHITFKHNQTTGKSDTFLGDRNIEKEIRSMAVAEKVSPVAAVGFVRQALVRQQQAMGIDKGIVMDGRDIGTIVFPDAELKIFVTARPEIRAKRRQAELSAKGETITIEEVLRNLETRDLIDSTRKDGPLRKADDAITFDNSDMTIEEQNRRMQDIFKQYATY
ncbi:MAG: (d)CMP kinase [Dysgonamonadaceae bacterium]|jgi:cytidylate kinase|nr:(d)CMP kinase [Dysgonamonadaceae bacterium]